MSGSIAPLVGSSTDRIRSAGVRHRSNTKVEGAAVFSCQSESIPRAGSVQLAFVSAMILPARRNGNHIRRPPSCSASKTKISLEIRLALEKIGVAVNRTAVILLPNKRQEMPAVSPALGSTMCCSSNMPGASGTTRRAKARPREWNPSPSGASVVESSYVLPALSKQTSKPRRVRSL